MTWSNTRSRSGAAASQLLTVLVVLWLVVGAIAAGQRHYYSNKVGDCAKAGTVVVTILAGPLNYMGVNPKISCHVPQPSK
jgi:hypothetical protein